MPSKGVAHRKTTDTHERRRMILHFEIHPTGVEQRELVQRVALFINNDGRFGLVVVDDGGGDARPTLTRYELTLLRDRLTAALNA